MARLGLGELHHEHAQSCIYRSGLLYHDTRLTYNLGLTLKIFTVFLDFNSSTFPRQGANFGNASQREQQAAFRFNRRHDRSFS